MKRRRRARRPDAEEDEIDDLAACLDGSVGRSPPEEVRRTAEDMVGPVPNLRIHTGQIAAEAADAGGVDAFSVGRNVYFGRGAYRPGTVDGDRRIAHEAAHVRQQGHGATDAEPALRGPEGSEREARRAAEGHSSKPISAGSAPPGLYAEGGWFDGLMEDETPLAEEEQFVDEVKTGCEDAQRALETFSDALEAADDAGFLERAAEFLGLGPDADSAFAEATDGLGRVADGLGTVADVAGKAGEVIDLAQQAITVKQDVDALGAAWDAYNADPNDAQARERLRQRLDVVLEHLQDATKMIPAPYGSILGPYITGLITAGRGAIAVVVQATTKKTRILDATSGLEGSHDEYKAAGGR